MECNPNNDYIWLMKLKNIQMPYRHYYLNSSSTDIDLSLVANQTKVYSYTQLDTLIIIFPFHWEQYENEIKDKKYIINTGKS